MPVSSLINLKPDEILRYSQIWQKQGWPTKFCLCRFCKQNCELAKQEINLWLCPRCRKCFVYGQERKPQTPAHSQLPTSCSCGWKKQHLSKVEQKRIADQAIKSRLSYQLDNKTGNKTYFAWCSFCEGTIEGQKRKKEVRNRNKVKFWSGKVEEERLVCNSCVRRNEEFLKLLDQKHQGRWRVYKSKGLV